MQKLEFFGNFNGKFFIGFKRFIEVFANVLSDNLENLIKVICRDSDGGALAEARELRKILVEKSIETCNY